MGDSVGRGGPQDARDLRVHPVCSDDDIGPDFALRSVGALHRHTGRVTVRCSPDVREGPAEVHVRSGVDRRVDQDGIENRAPRSVQPVDISVRIDRDGDRLIFVVEGGMRDPWRAGVPDGVE